MKLETNSILPPLDVQGKLRWCLSLKKLKVTTISVIDLQLIDKISLSITLVGKHHPDLYSSTNETQKEQTDYEIMVIELSLE